MYTERQQRLLGLTQRAKVGKEWRDAGRLESGGLEALPYPKKLQNYLGVKNQVALAQMMEEEYSSGRDE